MKAYKGFNKDMTCSPDGVPFQYEEGKEYETELICARMERVDGEKIKPDTWYKLENGEFVEVEDEK